MLTAEEVGLAVLRALVSTVGLDGLVKLVLGLAGNDRVKAILEAEYAANDVAAEVYEQEKLKGLGGGSGSGAV